MDLVKCIPASMWQEFLDELAKVDEDPEREAWKQEIVYALLEARPDLRQKLIQEELDKGRREAARAALRCVLAGRRLALNGDHEVLIDACEDLATLERWLDQTLTAASAADALQ